MILLSFYLLEHYNKIPESGASWEDEKDNHAKRARELIVLVVVPSLDLAAVFSTLVRIKADAEEVRLRFIYMRSMLAKSDPGTYIAAQLA